MRNLLVSKSITVIDHVATGGKIRLAREKAGLAQVELARRIGLSPSHMNNLEAGKRTITPEVVDKIKDALTAKRPA